MNFKKNNNLIKGVHMVNKILEKHSKYDDKKNIYLLN